MSSTSVGSIPQLKKLVNHLLDWSSHSKWGWSWWHFLWTPRFHGLWKSFLSHKHIQLTATFQKQQWKQLATQLSFQVRQWFGAREREEQQCLETLHEPPALLRPGISSVSKQAGQRLQDNLKTCRASRVRRASCSQSRATRPDSPRRRVTYWTALARFLKIFTQAKF